MSENIASTTEVKNEWRVQRYFKSRNSWEFVDSSRGFDRKDWSDGQLRYWVESYPKRTYRLLRITTTTVTTIEEAAEP